MTGDTGKLKEDRMRFITDEDIDLIRTFALSLKMKNYQKTISYFREKFEKEPNEKNAFHYGLCMCAFIFIETNDTEKPKYQFAMNEAFSRCLQLNDHWWLVRYLRSEINDGIPEEAFRANQFQSIEIAFPEEDRKILIQQQKESSNTFSYFLSPYLARVRAAIRNGDLDGAKEIYQSALKDVPVTVSPFDLSYLSRPFYDTIVYLRKIKMNEWAEEIKKKATTIFPGSRNLRMA